MNIAVCEDNRADAVEICRYIEEYCRRNAFSGEIKTFETAEALLEAFERERFHIVFLDIYLPGLTGLEAARRIRARSTACALVLITLSPDHALEGFEVSAASYVVKPLNPTSMARALSVCRREFLENSRTLCVPVAGGETKVPLPRLHYVEVRNKSVLLHLSGGTLEARIPLEEVERRLAGAPFLRCHRSFIVNMNHVAHTDEQGFLMTGGDRVPIRVNGGREVRLALARFIAGHRAEEG